jgi:hypothetical protein
LDFTLSYFPTGVTVVHKYSPAKWICGDRGLSVAYDFDLQTPYGAGTLRVDRFVLGRRVLAVDAANDRVTSGSIRGAPAIFIHPADDESGLGHGAVFVIEDDTSPEFTVLRVIGDEGIPFSELLKIVEGVR